MKPRILLVAPSLGFESIFPLGLSTIASTLMDQNYICIGLDERARPGCLLDVLTTVSDENRPFATVIEASPRNINQAILASSQCTDKGIPTILVGPAAAVDPAAMMDSSTAFASVTGDPETVIPALLDEIKAPTGKPIPGTRYRTGEGIFIKAPPVFTMSLDNLVYDRTVFPLCDYCDHIRHPEFRQAAVETSRGCNQACTFCPVPRRYNSVWRGRPIQHIVDEMHMLRRDYGITDFVIEDDQPLYDMERFHDLMRAIRDSLPGVTLAFSNGLRPDLLTMKTIGLMAAAGTRDISLGIESGSKRIRKSLNRQLSNDHIEKVIAEAHRLKVLVTGYFMLGMPGENLLQILQTIMAANRFKFDYVHFMVYHAWQLTTGPASEAYDYFRTAAYLGSYMNPLRLKGLAQSGELRAGRARTDLMQLIKWVMAGRTGGGTW